MASCADAVAQTDSRKRRNFILLINIKFLNLVSSFSKSIDNNHEVLPHSWRWKNCFLAFYFKH